MTEAAVPAPGPTLLPTGRMEGRVAFADLVRQALTCAAQEGWPRIILSDADFADWPLGERSVVDALQAWSRRGRELHFLARDFNPLRQRHPRLVQWRVTWSHIVDARVCRGAAGEAVPSAIWSPAWTLERVDPQRCVMLCSREPARASLLHEKIDACWQLGAPSFAATTLGL